MPFETFLTWKFLHITSMFFAVALAVSTELVLRRVAASRDAAAIRVVIERVRTLGNVSTVLFIAGLVFGILAALAGQIDLLRPWLIASYIAFAAAMVIGITITEPWVTRLHAAATSSEGAGASGLAAVIDDSRARLSTYALMVLVALFVFLMVVKPGG